MRARAIALSVIGLLAIASALPVQADERRLALLIGNQGYAEAVGPLENPHNDIELIKRALMSVGFAEDDIRIVTEADRVEILSEVDQFAARVARAGEDAISFFYYSGHGAANDRRENYLIPVDVPELTATGFWYRSVSLRDIVEQLDRVAPNARHFVIFDACRNTLKLREPGTRSLVQPKGFEIEGNIPGGMLIAFATAEGELASDVGDRAGPYASVLAEELVRPGVEAVTAFRNTQLRVRQRIQQEPWFLTNGLGELYFAGRAAQSEAAQAWAAIQNSESEAVLETFISRFGDSVYASFAAARLKELRGETDVAVGTFPDQPEPQAGRCDGVEVALASGGTECVKPRSGESFKDCAECPEMVVVPAGNFMMGSTQEEIAALTGARLNYLEYDGQQHEVRIPVPFAVGKFEITNAHYVAFLNDVDRRGTEEEPWFETNNEDSRSQITGSVGAFAVEAGKENFPVVTVSWFGATAYAKWLSEKTGKSYRLLSEAEWEYAARAGTKGPFSFEGPITTDKANYDGDYSYAGSPKGEYRERTVPVDSFQPNPWGLYQVHGNVWEWVEDCLNASYADKPDSLKASGAAWTTGNCVLRVVRGGSWRSDPQHLRSASRIAGIRDFRNGNYGFRLARTLTPPATSDSACRVLADTLSARVEIREGDKFCDTARQHTARVARISDQSIRFVVNGTKTFTCREGELCGFDWSPGPRFRITARADRARGIEPRGALLPR